ncbi:TadE/TadG family type IV pilus assembly protein [Granulicella aggregans]|uniref:TadE/TadG family type IV pilus assembly protein n=1 Tax=Granulicella aggregans TaxID=474949 RepID=UPI0021E07637|nr:TadE family protein [Granulicella aggregans]
MPQGGKALSVLSRSFRALCRPPGEEEFLRSEQGAELVEFALAFMILMNLIFGIISFCLALFSAEMVAHCAQQGARYAVARGGDHSTPCSSTVVYDCVASSSDVQNYIYTVEAGPMSKSSTTVTTTWPGTTPDCNSACIECSPTNSRGCYVEVLVSYTFQLPIPLMEKITPTFSSTSYQVIQ